MGWNRRGGAFWVTIPAPPEQFPVVGSASLNQLHLVPNPPSIGAVSSNTIDEACFDAYQREIDYLTRTLQRLGVAPGDVEDLTHEVFLVLRRTWHDYDPTRPLKPYLFGIAFRVASSHRRRFWREVPFALVEGLDRAPCPDQVFESNQARALVLAALQRISLPGRAVLVMHDLDEIPVQDVADTLSIPLFTAYSRLRKARRDLEAAITHMQKRSVIR
jgi:RNA polymerase sigma-70 factor (ECF subfamily)